jgi:hypothetical protein
MELGCLKKCTECLQLQIQVEAKYVMHRGRVRDVQRGFHALWSLDRYMDMGFSTRHCA